MANSEYMEMIELPVSTCEIIVAPKKKKIAKRNVVKKVNKKIVDESKPLDSVEGSGVNLAENNVDIEKRPESDIVLYEKKEKKKFKFDLVAAQVAAIFVIVVAIILTNVFWENSGINTLIKSVFSTESITEDARSHDVFSATVPSTNEIVLEEGVMTIAAKGSVYSPVEGEIADVFEKDGEYTLTIRHSDKFKSIISGLDHAYAQKGEKVYKGIPVGYSENGECKVAMFEDDSLITAYSLDGGSIVWEK